MKLLSNNKKLILGIVVGLIISVVTVYATGYAYAGSEVSFDNTTTNLTKQNGDPVETIQDALEAIYRKASSSSTSTCSNSPFHLGDYISMTPTSTSFTPDRTLTGLVDYDTFKDNADGTTTVSGTLHPNYLNVWRVIRINPDCTVEVVSEYVSDANVKFASKVGYQNYVYYLNEISKQYANTTYTLDPSTAPDGAFRNVGYDGQTKQINLSITLPTGYTIHPLNDETLGTASGKWYKKNSSMDGVIEELGGGDFKFTTDLELMEKAGVGITAYKKTGTGEPAISSATLTSYWLSSRLFSGYSTSNWYFYARYMNYIGTEGNINLWYRSGSSWNASANNYAVRPIVTLKSGLTIASGDGTKSSPIQLSVS